MKVCCMEQTTSIPRFLLPAAWATRNTMNWDMYLPISVKVPPVPLNTPTMTGVSIRWGKKLGRPASELDIYKKRSQNYKNLFYAPYRLMSGKDRNGNFPQHFDPVEWWGPFTEGNSWHYSRSVFHDMRGLINLMGGDKNFVAMLDSVFTTPPVFGANTNTRKA